MHRRARPRDAQGGGSGGRRRGEWLARGAPLPQLKSLHAIETAAEKLNPAEAEGFVAVDAKWNRIKIKSPAYVAMHHLGAVPTAG